MTDQCQIRKWQTLDIEYAEAIIDFILYVIGATRPRYMDAWVYVIVRLAIEYKRQNKNMMTASDPYIGTFVLSPRGLVVANISVHFLNWTVVALVNGPIQATQHERHLRNVIRELLQIWDLWERFQQPEGRLSSVSRPLFGQQGVGQEGTGRTIGGCIVTA